METDWEKLITLLRKSRKMLVFTGAGISTGSGIPDFRGPEGVWKKRQPVYYHDFMRSEAARLEHWDYKLEGWQGFRNARPNATHEAIVKLERAGKVLAVVTQNIDGLHELAGTPADRRRCKRNLSPGGGGCVTGLNLPSFSHFAPNDMAGFRRIFGAHLRAVPFQLLAHAQGDAAQQDDFGEISRDIKIRIAGTPS